MTLGNIFSSMTRKADLSFSQMKSKPKNIKAILECVHSNGVDSCDYFENRFFFFGGLYSSHWQETFQVNYVVHVKKYTYQAREPLPKDLGWEFQTLAWAIVI